MKRKSAQKNHRRKIVSRGKKKLFYKAVSVVLTFAVSFVFLAILSAYKYLDSSFASAQSYKYDRNAYTSDQFPTLVYAVTTDTNKNPIFISELKYIIFDKLNNRMLVYEIPTQAAYDIPGKYGEEQFSKIVALAGLNSDDEIRQGAELLKGTLFKIIGYKTDRFLFVDEGHSRIFDELLGNGSFLDLIKIKDIISSRDNFKTDLSFEEFYDLFSFVKKLPNDRIEEKLLSENDLANPEESIDQVLIDMNEDSTVASESKSISVLNGTDTPGVAYLGTRIINNMGGRVVASGNADRTYSTSVIITDDPNSETCRLLSEVFGIYNIVQKDGNNLGEHEIDRSDIVVIIGFDTSYKLY